LRCSRKPLCRIASSARGVEAAAIGQAMQLAREAELDRRAEETERTQLVGVARGELDSVSMGEIMSRYVELSEHGQKPLVKVYTAGRLRRMFAAFEDIQIVKRQLLREELPQGLRWFPLDLAGRLFGWNLILKAQKPR